MNLEVLKEVADILNSLNCTWAVGGSLLLKFYGIVDCPNDIDILVDSRDTEKIKKIMDTVGKYIPISSKEPFKTKEFFAYDVKGTITEFMGDFKIQLDNDKIYEFILDDKSIVKSINIDKSIIPITSLEDWFVAYLIMKDPKKRVPLIKEYFSKSGIKYVNLLERNLQQDLPKYIKEEIENTLNFKQSAKIFKYFCTLFFIIWKNIKLTSII